MEVIEGTGGVMALTDEDKVEIKKTLEDEVLPARPGRVQVDPGHARRMMGSVSRSRASSAMNGNVHPLDFELERRRRRSGIRLEPP